ncbi:MAG: hypothetical protein JWN28_103 [Candidatus Saccharibacteria bacterium]|nr:hypothetical protein [Candidatus Saccharibacteria bacterium]
MFQNQYTYKYIAQAPTAYGSDAYGSGTYSCASTDAICLAGIPGAPNTGFLVSSNPVFMGGIFITAALVITVIVYAIIRKVKQPKAAK